MVLNTHDIRAPLDVAPAQLTLENQLPCDISRRIEVRALPSTLTRQKAFTSLTRDVRHVNVVAHVPLIVDRHAPRDEFRPAILFAGWRTPSDVSNVRHADCRGADKVAGALGEHGDTPIRLNRRNLGHHAQPMVRKMRLSVGKGNVDLVNEVLDILKEIALPEVLLCLANTLLLETWQSRHRRCPSFAEVDEYQPKIRLRRIAQNAHPTGKRRIFGRYLDTLPARVVHPAMVEAAEAVALHPARRQLGTAMGAAEREHMRSPALTTVQGKVLAHDADGHRVASLEVTRHVHRLPERPQVAACQRLGPRVREVCVVCGGVELADRHGVPP